MRVFVYWNSTKKIFSIRAKNKVIAHAHNIILEDAEFKVSESGRQRVLDTGRKNVHAGVTGRLIACDAKLGMYQRYDGCEWPEAAKTLSYVISGHGTPVAYDPFKMERFMVKGADHYIDSASLTLLRVANRRATIYAWD